MDEALRKEIVAEIAAYTQAPRLESDEITRSDYARFTGLGQAAVTSALEGLVEQGALTRRQVYDTRTRRRVWAYRKTGEAGDILGNDD